KSKMQPHGVAWKFAFRRLSEPYLKAGVFPETIDAAFRAYLKNPAASTMSFLPLNIALRAYDKNKDGLTRVMDLPENAVFHIAGGRTFVKGRKLRTRFRCICLNNRRVYLFSPLAEVSPQLKPQN
ncbi:MAG: hypothetical protein PHX54_01040, partial [Lentimicrobiaceae bacterium]|nr:hypothetical protein [Lentimicrobiaceae bacterium]